MNTRTHKRGIYFLALACVSYGGWLIYESLFSNKLSESILIYHPDQITPINASTSVQSDLPSINEFSRLWQRPWQRPLHQKAPPPPPPKRIPPLTLKLTGVIDDGESKTAIIQDRQNRSHFIKIGETLQDATVTAIDHNAITVRYHDQIMKLDIKP